MGSVWLEAVHSQPPRGTRVPLIRNHQCLVRMRLGTVSLTVLEVACRQVSIWREAKGKLSCVTGSELTKTIGAVYRLEPVIDLTVAVGCEGGRVLLLRIMEEIDGDLTGASSVAKMMQMSVPSHDDKLRIVQVPPPTVPPPHCLCVRLGLAASDCLCVRLIVGCVYAACIVCACSCVGARVHAEEP